MPFGRLAGSGWAQVRREPRCATQGTRESSSRRRANEARQTIRSGRVEWTSRTYQLFGFEPGAVVPSYGFFLRRVHPSDRARVMEWLTHAIRQGGRTALEFRIERPDGSVRRLRSAGRVMQGADREVASMAGIVEDVTDQQQRRPLIPAGA